MLGHWGRDAGSLLGVDIALDSIQMLQVRKRGGRCERVAWVHETFEPLAAGHWWQDPGRVELALRDAYRRSGTRQRRVAVALPVSQVICKRCQLPASQTAAQMEAQLLADADTLFPFPLDDLVIDFHAMGASTGRPGYRDVIVAACRQSTLQPLEALFEAAGLQLDAVEVDSIALRRLLPPQGTGASALLRVEPDAMTLHGWMPDGLPQRRDLPGHACVDRLAQWVVDELQVDDVLVCGAARGDHGRLMELSQQLTVPCRPLPAVAGLDCSDSSLACALALGGLR
ncbi:type IV pilus biogenesis protein PilM [Pseudomonas plecoglossicida]|uniref:Pilus assembly protein PilM n=1 Tax=Pseudomonas plecoglossicida TaxID=70775 RepID=A0AAD0QZ16_PSEDL|nr:pilus assembly protein PilM [Pseudomonas plecoglossicida]AXM97022.1 pilus assembly protein PilM [Pseudomonas plecoglossicida]EPB95651.1 type IV pili biogenesis protein PilM [Pseudomonas plecoglossicida NB2011]QLB53606.1 pilus assembly protein PilM [Pseudomonas plecoglossicida]